MRSALALVIASAMASSSTLCAGAASPYVLHPPEGITPRRCDLADELAEIAREHPLHGGIESEDKAIDLDVEARVGDHLRRALACDRSAPMDEPAMRGLHRVLLAVHNLDHHGDREGALEVAFDLHRVADQLRVRDDSALSGDVARARLYGAHRIRALAADLPPDARARLEQRVVAHRDAEGDSLGTDAILYALGDGCTVAEPGRSSSEEHRRDEPRRTSSEGRTR